MNLQAAQATMWQLVQRYTGRVGYQRGIKAEGLAMIPPVVDCSGWVALLLSQAMQAENAAVEREIFDAAYIQALHTWSDRIVQEIEDRTGWCMDGQGIESGNLPQYATMGLKMGTPAWANNHPRPRGITHIVQVVCRPEDGASFVTEAYGGGLTPGISVTPLVTWLDQAQPHIRAGEVWVVDPFKRSSPA